MEEAVIDDAVAELSTIRDLLRWVVTQFNAASLYYGHGTDNSWDEAVQLVLAGLSLPLDIPTEMYSARLTARERKHLIEWVVRRVEERVPIAYLTHTAWFCGLSFYVDERVLVPRSPIGELIDKHFLGQLPAAPQRILDMCTGSGCIAIACASAYPQAEVDAVDISADALAVAERNIQAHGLEHQVTPLCSDLFCDLLKDRYDLIIANPPYVDSITMAELPPEYTHEPELALAAGVDGLLLVHRLLLESADYLSDNAVLICEVGDSRLQLEAHYPNVPFTWLTFERGGHGVFLLTREQLITLGNSNGRE